MRAVSEKKALFLCLLGISLAAFMCGHEINRNRLWRKQKADIENALEMYKKDCLSYPTLQQGIVSLFRKPVLDPVPENWNGPYAVTSTYDPWGRRLRLEDFMSAEN